MLCEMFPLDPFSDMCASVDIWNMLKMAVCDNAGNLNSYNFSAPRQSQHCVKSVRIPSFSGSYSVRKWGNADQENSEYGHFSRSGGHFGDGVVQRSC